MDPKYPQPTSLTSLTRLILLSTTLLAVLLILGAGAALASFPTSLSSPPLGKSDPTSTTPTSTTPTSTTPAQPDITCSNISFATAVNYGAGATTYSVVAGDFNRDGKQDLATANLTSNNVSILLGTGTGTFGAATNFTTGASTLPRFVTMGDFNRDGNLDLVTANVLSNNLSILLGTGTGSFGAPAFLTMGTGPYSVGVGDFNEDGKQDIVTANNSSNNVSVRLGTGTGSFGAVANFGLSGATGPNSVVVGDFDADGGLDLATSNNGTSNVSVLFGTGTGSFGAANNRGLNGGTNPFSVAVGDFDHDGLPDLATANNGTNNVSILLNAGSGAVNYGLNGGSSPQSVTLGDFNADSIQDLAVSNANTNNVSILQGNGDGTFGTATNFGLNGGTTPSSVAVGDFNADGRQDLATANQSTSNVSVLLSNCTAVCQMGYFATATNFGLNGALEPESVAVGDFNRDGKQDLATANHTSNNISILPGNGSGSFGTATNFGLNGGTGVYGMVVGDFNADGKQDLATANYGSDNVSILLGNGSGSFGTATNFGLNGGGGPVSVAVGDFNADGKQDIATANFDSNNISILLGNGSGSFGTATNFGLNGGTHPQSVAVGDFNADGKQDIATANFDSNNISILLGNGSGSFGTATNFGLNGGTHPQSVAVGDFNGDGKQDLATANQGSNNVSILLGNGNGTFGIAATAGLNGGTGPLFMAVGDFNADGKQDLATANGATNNVSILLGNGSGSFGTATNFGLNGGDGPTSVAVGDFNADGKQDLSTANLSANVSVLLGACQPAATPTNTSVAATPTRTNTAGPSPTCSAGGLTEGFESGTLGAFTNVVPTCVPGGCNWTSDTGNPHSGTRSAFAPDVANISDQYLEQTNPLVPSAGSTLTFWHHYNTEATFDGGVLEATTNNGSTWTDMGPNITAGTYNGTISSSFGSPISGRQAWTGNSGSYVQTTVNLSPYAGQSLRIRFRLATDNSQAAVGWDIDDITIYTGCGPTSTPQPPTSTPTRTNTPPPGATNTPTFTRTPTPTRTPTRANTSTSTNTSIASTPTRTNTRTNTPTNTPTRTHTPGPSPTACVIGGLSEGFESGTLGAFTNVVPICVPGGCNWISDIGNPHSGTRSAFAPDRENLSDQYLQQTNALVPSAGSTLTFWHNYNTEFTYDGGVLESTTNNGSTWTDMGPNITSGGYSATINLGFQSPIAGRQAWTGTNGAYTQVSVNLTPYAGQSLRIRFRLATDNSQAAVGWDIDDITISGTPCATNTPTITPTNTPEDTATRTPTSPPQSTSTPTQPAGATNTPNTNPTPCTIQFTDVLPGSTFYDFVRCMACRGIINGYTTGCETGNPCFRPTNNVTRGQLSKIVSLAANFNEPTGAQQFEDVLPGSTFYDFIWRLYSRGIVNGYPCGSPGEPCGAGNLPYFRPNNNITRAQLSKIVSEGAAFNDTPGAQQYEDVVPGSTFYAWIWRLANRGIVGGYACGGAGEPCGAGNLPYFRPGNNASRGQASKIVANSFFPNCVTPFQLPTK